MNIRAVFLQKNAFASMTYPHRQATEPLHQSRRQAHGVLLTYLSPVMNGEDNGPTGGAPYYAYLRAMDPGG